MSEKHKLVFESDDYNGPTMKLEFDCSNAGYVVITQEAEGTGMTASIDYGLYQTQEVEKVIAALTAWRERERERTGR